MGSLKKINNLFIKDIFHGYCLKRQSLSLCFFIQLGYLNSYGFTADYVFADKGYDSDHFIETIRGQNAEPAAVFSSNLLIDMGFLFIAPYAGAISKNLVKKPIKSIYYNLTPLRAGNSTQAQPQRATRL